jgi:transcription antitermination factor NusG
MSDFWFALHVRPRFEKFSANHLSEKGYEVFLPTYVSKRKWSDRVKTISLPLFPSYIFCRFDIQSRLPILIAPGVKSIVGVGKLPTPVDESEIAAVRHVMESTLPSQPWPYLSVGETVRVEKGPLKGVSGIVVRVKGVERLIVSVSLLMRSVCVEIDRSSVTPLEPTTKLETILC